jgi:hypothetical protein
MSDPRKAPLDKDVQSLIRSAFGKIPFAGLQYGNPETVGDLVEMLDSLAETLRGVSADYTRTRDELTFLRNDVDAFRRIIGTAPTTS